MPATAKSPSPDAVLSLAPLMNPASVAIIGASSNFAKPGGRPIEALKEYGYQGRIYPVNPKYDSIGDLKCYPSILEVPEPVDTAIISVPAASVLDVVGQCGQRGVKSVIIFSSGFAEVGGEGKKLQERLKNLARQARVRVCGPNCYGIVNVKTGAMCTFSDSVFLRFADGGNYFGFVSQSGGFGWLLFDMAQKEGVGFSFFVSSGNEADADLADYMAYMLEDPGTKVIGSYVEQIRYPAKMAQVARRALELKKPILMFKVGTSSVGAQAAASHTGAMAGSDQVYDAFFKQTGIVRVKTVPEMATFARLVRAGRFPQGKRVGIMSGSGGGAVVLADRCEELGLVLPELDPATQARMEEILPEFASCRNPADITGAFLAAPEVLYQSALAFLSDPNIDMGVLLFAISGHTGVQAAQMVARVYRQVDKPLLVIALAPGEGEMSAQAMEVLSQAGIPVALDFEAVKAMATLAEFAERARILTSQPAGAAGAPGTADRSPKARRALRDLQGRPGQPVELTEHQAKRVLSAYDIPVTKEGVAHSPEEAVAIARRLGYPVVLKIESPDILHKTDAGGVKLGLAGDQEVKKAYAEILDSVYRYNPEAQVEGILVQEMLPQATEVIVGLTQDPTFGPVVVFGLGGILVEVMKDVSMRVAPLSRRDAEEMIREIKGYPILTGVRGRPKADIDAVIQVLLQVSELATDLSGIVKELDINPLMVFPQGQGVKAADALMVLGKQASLGGLSGYDREAKSALGWQAVERWSLGTGRACAATIHEEEGSSGEKSADFSNRGAIAIRRQEP